jgi:hypothetical protein
MDGGFIDMLVVGGNIGILVDPRGTRAVVARLEVLLNCANGHMVGAYHIIIQ